MTVQNRIVKNVYEGNGNTTVFPYTFHLAEDDGEYVRVFKTNAKGEEEELSANFRVDTKERKVIYPLSGAPLPVGCKIVLIRDIPEIQELNLENQGEFFADDIEYQLDRIVMMIQEIKEELGRCVKTLVSDSIKGEDFAKDIINKINKLSELLTQIEELKSSLGELEEIYNKSIPLHEEVKNLHDKVKALHESIRVSHSNIQSIYDNVAPILGGITGKGAVRFLTDGSYTVPEGVTEIYVSGCGGGAGGGWISGGGGAQSVIRKKVSVTPGMTYQVKIGKGGAGHPNPIPGYMSQCDCRAGGDTALVGVIALKGGKYADAQDSFVRSPISEAGGIGGTAGSAHNIVYYYHQTIQMVQGGRGGDSLFGTGGGGGVAHLASEHGGGFAQIKRGESGIGYGSGGGGLGWCCWGSGASNYRATPTGDGANGILIIEVF